MVGSTVGIGWNHDRFDTGTVATNGAGWSLGGRASSNTAPPARTRQQGIHNAAQMGSAVAALITPAALTLWKRPPILIAVTGNATTTATDIALNLFGVNAAN